MSHYSRPRRYEPRYTNGTSFGNKRFLSTDNIPGRSLTASGGKPSRSWRDGKMRKSKGRVYTPLRHPRRIRTYFHANKPDPTRAQGSLIYADSILLSGKYTETSVLPENLLQGNCEFLWPRPQTRKRAKDKAPAKDSPACKLPRPGWSGGRKAGASA